MLLKKSKIHTKLILVLVLFLYGSFQGSGQTSTINDFQDVSSIDTISNEEIPIEGLVLNYKPSKVFDYETAREVLFTEIYNENDTISCVYTNYKLPVSKNEDNPISKLIKLNPLKSIIAEHSYPRSKGAKSGNAKSDMHHLFPVRLGVNVARYNHPFANIPDDTCIAWYDEEARYQSKPTEDDGNCAKKTKEAFEPQDNFKGNVARAVFYFYTMYMEEALAEDEAFFEFQRETLLQWHRDDPVDEAELKRTYLIAAYQSDKANPFVLDKTLAFRLYDK